MFRQADSNGGAVFDFSIPDRHKPFNPDNNTPCVKTYDLVTDSFTNLLSSWDACFTGAVDKFMHHRFSFIPMGDRWESMNTQVLGFQAKNANH